MLLRRPCCAACSSFIACSCTLRECERASVPYQNLGQNGNHLLPASLEVGRCGTAPSSSRIMIVFNSSIYECLKLPEVISGSSTASQWSSAKMKSTALTKICRLHLPFFAEAMRNLIKGIAMDAGNQNAEKFLIVCALFTYYCVF